MANERARKALQEARDAIVAVHEGRVERMDGELRREGVRAYVVNRSAERKLTPPGLRVRKRLVAG
ncbi:MAG TPA: hypothetical protein VFQ35_10220 [Polyangiaceae bacterium]|nr:hypothetical protein [Polyangiaceae bacterium]